MMAKIVKKSILKIRGIYHIEDGVITIEIEDEGEYSLEELSNEFRDKTVTISIGCNDEIA